jgi:two-component system sensor histidine kinase HydH
MRRARFGLILICSLLAVGWGLGISVFYLLRRQAAQDKRLEQQHELVRLGEVGAVLAHEVRNPLAGIKGYGQLLEERLPEGRERGYAQLIVRESLRLEQLTNDILFYTRADAGPVQSSDLPTVFRQLTELLSSQLGSARVNMVVNCDGPLSVRCSEDGLRRLLLNLLTNAIQAVPHGGRIALTAVLAHGMVEIAVADNGPGIEAEMMPYLFQPFRTNKARGAGLGLAVCKKIVDGCRGSISVDNLPDGGAQFVVRLPTELNRGGL